MSIRRVAVIYDDQDRPDTTGNYCFRALSKLAQVEHFLPGQMAQIPRQGFDLYLNIDESFPYLLPDDLRPSAFWAIDTHLAFERELAKALAVDVTFAAQRDGVSQLRSRGIDNVHWLPLACDPEIHRPIETENEFDFCFVGHLGHGERARLVQLLKRHFPRHFVGTAFFEEMAKTYSASKIAFNRSVANDVNMRVFEALACGSLLVTNDLSENGLAELFQDGVHLATYREPEELLDKVRFYLRNDIARGQIAARGRQVALAGHTYLDRMRSLLKTADSTIGRCRSRVAVTSPAVAGNSTVATTFKYGLAKPIPPHEARLWSELLTRIPASNGRVLLIGQGASLARSMNRLAETLDVTCIEPNHSATNDQVGSFENLVLNENNPQQFETGSFDAIVCHRTIERSPKPLALLRQLHEWIAPEGRLVTAVLNAQYHGTVAALIEGSWSHGPENLPQTPVIQGLTRIDIERLFYRASLQIISCMGLPNPIDDDWRGSQAPTLSTLLTSDSSNEQKKDFAPHSYLIESRAVAKRNHGLTSIVILTYNQCAFTKRCLESIRRFTDSPYELIFVDNGSTDETRRFLRSLDGITLIENDHNRGFPAGANQGIQAAHGQNILLLNNDTVVTTGWLDRMLDALHSDEGVGIVGPCTSWPPCPQQLEPPPRYDRCELERFAWQRGRQFNQQRLEVQEIVGFCMLVRRSVVDQVGALDEAFGIGECEDKDFCMRTKSRLPIVRRLGLLCPPLWSSDVSGQCDCQPVFGECAAVSREMENTPSNSSRRRSMILLLGGSGYVGAVFRECMTHRGIDFRSVRRHECDYYVHERLDELIAETSPEFLINASGFTGVPNVDACELCKADCVLGNVVLPGVIRDVCERRELPWGHVSSGCIYIGAGVDGHGFRESDPPNFTFRHNNCSFYSGCKALAEEMLANAENCYLWRLRIPFNHIDSERNYLSKLMRYARLLDVRNTLGQLNEFVEACLDCWQKRLDFGIYNLVNSGSITTREVAEMIRHSGICKKRFEYFASEDEFMQAAGRAPRSACVLDNAKARAQGLRLSHINDAIAESLGKWQPDSSWDTDKRAGLSAEVARLILN